MLNLDLHLLILTPALLRKYYMDAGMPDDSELSDPGFFAIGFADKLNPNIDPIGATSSGGSVNLQFAAADAAKAWLRANEREGAFEVRKELLGKMSTANSVTLGVSDVKWP